MSCFLLGMSMTSHQVAMHLSQVAMMQKDGSRLPFRRFCTVEPTQRSDKTCWHEVVRLQDAATQPLISWSDTCCWLFINRKRHISFSFFLVSLCVCNEKFKQILNYFTKWDKMNDWTLKGDHLCCDWFRLWEGCRMQERQKHRNDIVGKWPGEWKGKWILLKWVVKVEGMGEHGMS